MASDALKRRLLTMAVAILAAYVGLQLAGGFAFGAADRYLALGVAWFSVALALMLEPFSRASLRRALLTATGGALGGAVLTLAVMMVLEQSWYSPGETHRSLGSRLGHVWSPGDAVRIVLVLTFAALPAPLTLLLVRRLGRQLEWQAAAAALGPVFVGIALFPAELFGSGPLLLLLLSGLPFGFGAYLLDRRLLGPAALACFPEPVPVAPVEPTPATEPAQAPAESVRRSAPFPGVLLMFALAFAPAWAFVVAHVGHALAPSETFPGMVELKSMFDDVAARQEEHRARTGSYARTLGALEALPLDVRGGLTRGYVLRYARTGDARWILTADPVPARPGWPSLRLVGPGGELERGMGHFALGVEGP